MSIEHIPDDIHGLFQRYGTDKTCYSNVYHSLFRHLREWPKRILEIGIGTLDPSAHSNMVGWGAPHYRPGGSLRAWRDYFPKSQVYGLDIHPDVLFEEVRIRTYLCDSTSHEDVDQVLGQIGFHSFDIIIDDGSHVAANQVATLQNLYPFVSNGGFYIIEDVDERSSLLTQHMPQLRSICGNDPMLITQKQNIVIISKGLCE